MKYAGIIKNDFAAAPGVCVSFFTQGCPHKCKGCHNPETWNFDGGREFTPAVIQSIQDALVANGVERSLCIMGGEPLCEENISLTMQIVDTFKEKFQNLKIYIWTGYTIEELEAMASPVNRILSQCEALIDGRYIESERDTTLLMRGSRNQRIIWLKDTEPTIEGAVKWSDIKRR